MKEKRIHIFTGLLLAGIAVLISCGRSIEPIELPGNPPADEVGSVRIVVEDPLTKAGGIVYDRDEKPVDRWAFFIFHHSNGQLAYRGEVTDGHVATKRLRTGEYDIEVIANYPLTGPDAVDVSSIGDRQSFQALKVSLSQNSLGAFVMAGTREDADGNRIPFKVEKTEGEEVLEADIQLKRLVSKVVVSRITRLFSVASLGARPLTVKGVYLTNAYAEARYWADYSQGELVTSRSLWYNALGWHKEGSATPSDAMDALVGDRNLNLPLAQGESADLDVNLYFYPNPTRPSADVPSSEWAGTARCTRLVVWVQVDGKDYYYPATLPKEDAYAPIGRNSVFTVHCTLTALGSTEEDDWVPGVMEVTFESVLKNDGDWINMGTVTEDS